MHPDAMSIVSVVTVALISYALLLYAIAFSVLLYWHSRNAGYLCITALCLLSLYAQGRADIADWPATRDANTLTVVLRFPLHYVLLVLALYFFSRDVKRSDQERHSQGAEGEESPA